MARKTIYAAMTGGFGSLAQVLPILERLPPERYRIVCSIAHGAAHAIARLGCEVVEYPTVAPPRPEMITAKHPGAADLDEYWGRFGFADPEYFERLIASRLAILDRIAPDILLTQFCPPTEVMARIARIPLVCVTQSCWHPAGRALAWWAPRAERPYHPVTPAVNRALVTRGAPPIARMEDLNRGDITLIPSFEELDPIDAHVDYLGPMWWDSASRIGEHVSPSRSRPLVVVYTGHLHDSAGRSGISILEHVVAGLRDAEVEVVVVTGLGQTIDVELPAARNIRIYDWVDLAPLLARCALFVHHGGHGSCMAGLLAGAPALIIPTFQEREFNARQMHSLGLAEMLHPEQLAPDHLRARVLECLHHPALTARLARWRSELARRDYGGAVHAATRIESLLG